MSEQTETQDEKEVEKQTTEESSTENKQSEQTEDKEGKVPSFRLREETEKRKKAEATAQEALQKIEALSEQVKELASKKSDVSKAEYETRIDSLKKDFGLDEEVTRGLVEAAESKVKSELMPIVTAAQQEVAFNNELDALIDEIPEAEELTRAQTRELKKRAFSKEFARTPLKTIYRDMMFDEREDTSKSKKTAESARSGGRAEEKSPEDMDFRNMDIEKFREVSDKLGARRRRR